MIMLSAPTDKHEVQPLSERVNECQCLSLPQIEFFEVSLSSNAAPPAANERHTRQVGPFSTIPVIES
jgi:hypothetical protein